jgi:hypothetical protein
VQGNLHKGYVLLRADVGCSPSCSRAELRRQGLPDRLQAIGGHRRFHLAAEIRDSQIELACIEAIEQLGRNRDFGWFGGGCGHGKQQGDGDHETTGCLRKHAVSPDALAVDDHCGRLKKSLIASNFWPCVADTSSQP